MSNETKAPQPPAEAQAVAWRSQGKSGWTFTDMPHAHDIAVGIWEPLYSAPPPSAPVGVDGVKCPWDGGSPCVEPRPIGMVYPMKPAPRASGYLDGSGVEWNAWDAEQMEAYARAAYSDGWETGYRSALAQQPAAVDGAMLRKLLDYFEGINNDEDGDDYLNLSADAMDLIDSALAAQQGGSDNDR